MFNFEDYTNEIWTVARERNVDVGVAFDMFRTDIVNGSDRNCGDAVEHGVMDEAKEKWDELTDAEKQTACNEWVEFSRKNYFDICKAFADGPEAVAALVGEWKARNE